MDQAALTPWELKTAVNTLRVGGTATDAADKIGVQPGVLYAAARHHDDLLLALAGHDPYALKAELILQQARYVGLMALGMKPTQAARVLFHGDERAKDWRVASDTFAQVADQARRLHPPRVSPPREHHFTPYRVRIFLDAIRDGRTVISASEAAGITNAVVYQRRRRDSTFRAAMDAARAASAAIVRPEPEAITEDQWAGFRRGLAAGMTLRRAAIEAGIHPQRVYDRRRDDDQFRRDTDRLRGRAQAEASARPPAPRTPEDQWADFRRGLAAGMTLRRAAIEADIDPQRVYDRRRHDNQFRRDTDRLRGPAQPGISPRPPAPRPPSASSQPESAGRTPA